MGASNGSAEKETEDTMTKSDNLDSSDRVVEEAKKSSGSSKRTGESVVGNSFFASKSR